MTTDNGMTPEKHKKKVTFGGVVRTVVNTLVYIVMAAMILLAVLLMVSKAQGRTLFIGGRSVMWIMTGSMDDVDHTIPTQSYVLMEKVTDPDTVKAGDIVCFHSDDPDLKNMSTDLVVHRVVRVIEPADSASGAREFVTKGDANYVEDRYTAKADKIVARHVRNLPLMSFFGRLFASFYGMILLAIIVVAGIFTVYIPELRRRVAEEEEARAGERAAAHEAEIQRLVAAEIAKLQQEQAQAQAQVSERGPQEAQPAENTPDTDPEQQSKA